MKKYRSIAILLLRESLLVIGGLDIVACGFSMPPLSPAFNQPRQSTPRDLSLFKYESICIVLETIERKSCLQNHGRCELNTSYSGG